MMRRLLALTLLVALTGSACGSRHSDESIARAAGQVASPAAGSTDTAALPGPQTSVSGDSTTVDVAPPSAGAGAGSDAPPGKAVPTPAATGTPAAAPAAPGSPAAPAAASAPNTKPGTAPAAPATGAAAKPATVASPGSAAASTPGSPIKIGTIGQLSGPAGAVLKFVVTGVQIWAASVNAKGGLNGHRIEVLVADDGGDGTRHRQLMQQFVEEKGVIAFVGMPDALTAEGSVDYVTKARVPVVGSDAAGDFVYDSPMYFPQTTHGDTLLAGLMYSNGGQAVAKGLKKFAVITCVEAQACRDGERVYREIAPKIGGEIVYAANSSLAQPDYTSECLGARNADAEVLHLILDVNSVRRVAASCARQGYKPLYGLGAQANLDSAKAEPNLEGSFMASNVTPWWLKNAATQEYHQALATYAPGAESQPSMMLGWVSAKVFEKAAQNLPEPPTKEAVLEGLWTHIKNYDVGGLTYPLTYTRDQPAPRVQCWYESEIKGGQWVSRNDGQRTCL